MCGRARCTLKPEQVTQACGAGGPDARFLPTVDLDRYRPSYNVSPGAYLPVVAYEREKKAGEGSKSEGERRPVLHCMKWGLIPSFTKKNEKPDHYRMFNARLESISEKASFRRLIPKNRCLVAAEGFYEWKKDGSKKQPYYIHFKDERPLIFAALYDSWRNAEGELLYTFTILTTNSSTALQWLHGRMPVILGSKKSINDWLNSPTSEFDSILGPYEDSDLVWHPVTPSMGKPSFDGADCIKEIQLKPTEKKPISKFFSKKIDVAKQHKLDVQEMQFPESAKVPGIQNVKEEPGIESVKEEPVTVEEPGKIENRILPRALGDGEEESKPHVSHQMKEAEMCGMKRDHEQLMIGSQPPLENIGDLKKKGRTIKHAGDGQATLLSYFRRS